MSLEAAFQYQALSSYRKCVDRIAAAWAVLMARLGYRRYGAQGGDWGSAVTTSLGAQDPEHCLGIHITLAMGTRPKVEGQPTPEEARTLNARTPIARRWATRCSSGQRWGIGQTVPPRGPAASKYSQTLRSSRGGRKCTCMSARPGIPSARQKPGTSASLTGGTALTR